MVKVTQTVEPTIKTQDLTNKKEDFSKDKNNKVNDKQQEKKEIIINKPEQRKFSAESKNDKSTFNDIDKQSPKQENNKKVRNPLVLLGKTLGNISTNMGEGALKTGEGVLDTLNDWTDAINNPLTYLGNKSVYGKEKADKALKEDKKKQEEFIKRDLVKDFEDLTGYSDVKKDWEKDSLVKSENLGGQVAQGVGGMVPSLLAGQYLGLTPEMTSTKGLSGLTKAKAIAGNVAKSYVSQLPSNAILGASSYGSGLEEALNEGATREQARRYGLTNAAIEQGTEYLTGGLPGLGGKGGLDDVVEPLIDKTGKGYANALLKAGYGALGEGLEETAGTYLDALAKKGILGKDINWKDVNKEALQSGLVGAATGAILNSPSSIQDIQNARNEIRNQQAQRVQETPVQPSITQNNINTQEQIETTPTRQENEQITPQQAQTRVEPQTIETKPVEIQQNNINTTQKLENRVSGDKLLDAQDFINEVKDVGANVDDNGYVTVYHQTTPENAKKILNSGKMSSKEQAVFFSTSQNASQSDGRGSIKLEFKIPAEELELDDIFSDNADVKINLNGKEDIDVSKYLVENNNTPVETSKLTQQEQQELETLRNKNAGENPNIPAEIEKEEVLKFSPEQERQYYKNNGMSDETAKILTEIPKPEKTPIRDRIKEGKAKFSEQLGYFKRNLVDKGETIYKLGKKTKNPNLYAKYDKRGTTTGEANYDIGVGQTNLEGKRFENFTDKNGNKTSMSLNQIWEGIDPQIGNEYLAHYLNVDRYNQLNEDGTGKYVFGESITDKDSLNRIKELEKEHPELKRFGENVWQYGKNQLQTRVDAGQISQAQADQFLKDTPHYVRLQRNVDTKTSPLLEFDKNGNVKVNKNLKEFKGSTLDILPFKESMAQYTLDVRNSIRDNIFAQELAKTLGIDANGQTVDNIDDIIGQNPELLKDNGDGTYSLTFFNKGVATTIPVNEGIYESLQPNKHYKFEDTLPFKGIRKFDNFRKGLLTDKNPLFLATNMMKDAFDAPLNSKYPVSFAKNYPRAIKEILTNGKYYQQYQALGGLQNTYFDNQEFQKQGSKANPLTWIEKGNNAVEQFPRLAEFISTMEKTGDIDQAMYNAAEITTNFKRGGDWTKSANRNGVTFLNASVQGFSKQIRNFTDIQNPRQAAQLLGKIIALGIAPGLINDAMWDDDDEYKELQDYQKDNYYLFKGKDGKWIRIPKGRAISVFQSAARRTKYALKGDEKAFDGFVDFAKNQVAPNSPFENNIFAPLSQVSNNKSWSGNKIISDSLSKRPTEEQYNEKTDEISKWIGKQVKNAPIPENFKSPLAINYLIDQYSGVIGDVGLPMITPRSSSDTSNPIKAAAKDKFSFDAANSSKSVGNFYDKKDEIEKQKNSIKATPIDKAKNSYMTSRSMELSELYKKQKDIQNSNLSKEEKYNQSKEIQKQINKFAKETIDNVDNIEKEEYYIKIGDTYYKRVIKNGEETYVKDTSKKRPTEEYALYDYFRDKYYKSKESD